MTLDSSSLKSLSDSELLTSTRRLAASERTVTADLLVLLGEVDARGLHYGLACSSLFVFCTRELGFSEDAACNRIAVARLVRTLPEVMDAFRSGRVHLTALRLLGPHLNEDNHAALLAEAAGKSKREVEVMVARIAPKPPVPESIRKLPAPRQVDLLASARNHDESPAAAGASEVASASAPPDAPGPTAIPPRSRLSLVLLPATRRTARSSSPCPGRPSASSSPPAAASGTSCARRRTCSATSSRMAIWPPSWSGRSTSCWRT
jgi:hypothetical protein